MNLFEEWYKSQKGFYWDWLRQTRVAEKNFLEYYKKEFISSRKLIKQLKEELEIKNSEIKKLKKTVENDLTD